MILDMLQSIRHPINCINEATHLLLDTPDHETKQDVAPTSPSPSRPDKPKPSVAGGRSNGNGARLVEADRRYGHRTGPASRSSLRDTHTTAVVPATFKCSTSSSSGRSLRSGLGRLNVVMESSVAFGQIIMERAEHPYRWAGYKVGDVSDAVMDAEGVLKQLDGAHARMEFHVVKTALRGGRHLHAAQVRPPLSLNALSLSLPSPVLTHRRRVCVHRQVLYFAALTGVELLLSEWRKVVVTLSFDEVEDVEYEALVQVKTPHNTRPRVRA